MPTVPSPFQSTERSRRARKSGDVAIGDRQRFLKRGDRLGQAGAENESDIGRKSGGPLFDERRCFADRADVKIYLHGRNFTT